MKRSHGESGASASGRSSLDALWLLALVAAPWAHGCAYDEWPYALATLLLLASTLAAALAARDRRGLPPGAVPALALVAFGIVQAVLGTTASRVLTADAVLVLAAVAWAGVYWSDRARDTGAALRLATIVLVACAGQGLFGAVQWSLAPQTVYGRPSEYFSFGSFFNHNHFAGFVGMGVPLALGMAVGHWRRGHGPTPAVVGFGGLAVGLASAVLASRSRGGTVGLCAGIVTFGVLWASWVGRKERRAPRIVAAAAVSVALVGVGLFMVPGSTRQHLATALRGPVDGAGVYRVDVWRDTLRLVASRPFLGAGLGAYKDAFAAVKRGHGDLLVHHAENDWLELAGEGGLVGFVLVAWIGIVAWRGYLDRMTSGHDPVRKGAALGAMASACGLLVASLFNFNLHVPSNALLLASLIGLASAPRTEPRLVGGRAVSLLAGLLLLVLAAAAVWRTTGAWELRLAFSERDPERVLAAMDRVAARHPYLAEALRTRGNAWRVLARDDGAISRDRLARAEDDLTLATRLRPHWGDVWADLAWVRFLRGDLAGADAAMDTAVARDPSHLQILRSRALLQLRTEGIGSLPLDQSQVIP